MKKTLLASLAVLILVGLSSCSTDPGYTNPLNTESYSAQSGISPDLTITPGEGITYTMFDGSLTNDVMVLTPPDDRGGEKGRPPVGDRRGGPGLGKDRDPINLGRLLRALKLDDAQKEQVKGFLAAYHDCMKAKLEEFRTQAQPEIQATNALNREVMKSLKAGDITREEARTQIKANNDALKAKLDEIMATIDYCSCIYALLDSIDGLFEAGSDQQAAFDAWVANLKGPCFPRPQ